MDIWLVAVLTVWLPVAIALGVLVGRTLARSDLRERLARRRPRADTASPASPVFVRVAHHGHESLQRVRS